MNPSFSIVLPTYNVAPYLRYCLDSVLAQTFTDWEAICVDDGSTDGSGTILEEYASKDSRFHIVHQSNAGVSVARNVGLNIANGEWIWFVDSDDALHPRSLEFLASLAHKNPEVKTISFTTFREGDQVLGEWGDLPDISQCIIKDFVDSQSLRMHRRGACMTIVRTDIAKKFCFKKYVIGEDVLYHISILWAFPETCLLSAPIYFYRRNRASAVNSCVSKRKVVDLLSTEREMLLLYFKYSRHCDLENIKEYFKWNEDFVWYTFNCMFFKLPSHERNDLLDKWVELQKMQHTIIAPSFYKKFVLFIVQMLSSGMICKLLVCGPEFLKCRFNAMRRKNCVQKA